MSFAEFVNKKLDLEIYKEDMTLYQYDNKQIRKMCCDDLIYNDGNQVHETDRLIRLVNELKKEYKGE